MASDSLSSALTYDDNEDGWGPSTVPEKFKEIPYYTPFSKAEKLGKIADWQQTQYQGKGGRSYQGKDKETVNTIFSYFYNDDDSSFTVVDNTKVPTKKTFGPRKFQRGFQNLRQHRGGGQQQQAWGSSSSAGGRQKQLPRKHQNLQRGNWGQGNVRKWGDQPQRKRDPSLPIKEDWTLAAEIPFNALTKISTDEPETQDLKMCGFLESYDKSYDRLSARTERPLERTDRTFFNVTTSDDPIMKQFMDENVGTVYATGSILEHLMTVTRSVNSFDVIVRKKGDVIIFDKRDGAQLDFLTVSETAADPPEENSTINSPAALGREATLVNQMFSQQVLSKGSRTELSQPNPFRTEGEKEASVGYRYRKFTLDDDLVVVARTEVDALVGENHYAVLKALHEFDPKSHDWRRTVDTQKGSILAAEIKNNSAKFAQWTLQALLSGAQNIKLGYVARMTPKDPWNHSILGTQEYKPKEFAVQINFNIKTSWAVLKHIVQAVREQADGKYLLMRDPDQNVLKLWSVPDVPLEGESQ